MNKLLTILIVLIQFSIWSKSKEIILNGHSFSLESIAMDSDEDSVFIIKLYRIDSLNKKHYLLRHITKEKFGDCNSEVLELGTYSYTDSTIVFYSFWCTTGDAPASPYGGRKQTYKVDGNGKVSLFTSQLYIETSREDWGEPDGIEYLFNKPKTEVEKRQLKMYIKKVETEYNAKFVFYAKADSLIKEVKNRLKKQIQIETGYWDKNAPFGTRI